jgi:hypothetical protein
MIRDYLYQLSNIIQTNSVNKHNLKKMIHANNIVLKIMDKGLDKRVNKRKFMQNRDIYWSHITGGGAEEWDNKLKKSVQQFHGLNDKLKVILEKLYQNMLSDDGNKKHLVSDIQEMADVSIILIKYLGELIDTTNDKSYSKIQHQIADMMILLGKYLD